MTVHPSYCECRNCAHFKKLQEDWVFEHQLPPRPLADYGKMIEENLTSTQARCTELLLENRELKRKLRENINRFRQLYSIKNS